MKRKSVIDVLSILCVILFSWKNSLKASSIIIIVGILSILSMLAFQHIIKQRNLGSIITNNILTIIIILFCLISSIYSVDKETTLKQTLYLVLTTYFSILLSILCKKEEFLKIFSKYILISIVISIILWFIYPNNAFTIINGEVGGFQGVYIHKNILARNMIIGAIVCNYYSENYNKKLYKYISILCYLFIFISRSTTCILMLIVYFIFKKLVELNKYKIIVGVTIIYSLVISIVIYFNEYIVNSEFANLFTKITGKTIQFTGRINIWNNLLVGWKESPLLGRGYGALWSNSDYINYIKAKSGLVIYSTSGSHNGYFDILGGIGLIGITLILIFIYKICKKNKKNKNLIILIITMIVMINFFENYLLGMNSFWIILVYFFSRNDKFN